MLAQPVTLLLGASRPEEDAEGFAPLELGNGTEPDDAIFGESIDKSVDVPRHEERLYVANEGTRFLNRLRVWIVLAVCRWNRHWLSPTYEASRGSHALERSPLPGFGTPRKSRVGVLAATTLSE